MLDGQFKLDDQFKAIDHTLASNNNKLCELANQRRRELIDSPFQSHFRVYALLIIKLNAVYYQIEGTNSEPSYIGGSICAERAALVKLRLLPCNSWSIEKMVIVTDNDSPISPGLLCREYISSLASPDMLLVLASHDSQHIVTCTIQDLHPYPYLYNKLDRYEIDPFAVKYATSMMSLLSHSTDLCRECDIIPSVFEVLYNRTKSVISYDKFSDTIHPLQFAAGVMFRDGSVEVAWQLKGLEYGCTLDPVTQLIHEIEKRRYLCLICDGSKTDYFVNSEQCSCCKSSSLNHAALRMNSDDENICTKRTKLELINSSQQSQQSASLSQQIFTQSQTSTNRLSTRRMC